MKFWKEFKEFISKGNIVDLAVAVVIGTAFNKIVSSLVNDIIMPLITWGLGANSLADLSIRLNGEVVWAYGSFIQSVIDFLIIAFTIFIVLKILMKGRSFIENTAQKLKRPTKAELEKLKEQGVDVKDKKAVDAALTEMHEKEKQEKEEQEKLKKEEEYRNSTEGLLKEIRDLLTEQKSTKTKTKKESK